MPDNSGNQNKKSVNKGLIAVVIVAFVVIVTLLVVIAVMVRNNSSSSVEDERKRPVVVSQEKAEEIAEEMVQEEYVAPGYYNATMTTEWHFASGDAPSLDAYVENQRTNTNDVYFDIFLEDETTLIYSSPVIPRGERLENIKLDASLDAGTYNCLLIYHLVDEEQNDVSELRVGLTIIVEN